MQLFCDIDGVLLDFERMFVPWINRYHHTNLPACYQSGCWDFTDLLSQEQTFALWKRFMQSEQAAQMPSTVAPAAFNAATQQIQVELLTNFPAAQFPMRWANLHSHGFVYRGLYHCGLLKSSDALSPPPTKAQIVNQLCTGGKAFFVDDHPDNCLDVLQHCPQVEVWVMHRHFNRGFYHQRIQRATSWQTLFKRFQHAQITSATA